jgi:hypothetical protein
MEWTKAKDGKPSVDPTTDDFVGGDYDGGRRSHTVSVHTRCGAIWHNAWYNFTNKTWSFYEDSSGEFDFKPGEVTHWMVIEFPE